MAELWRRTKSQPQNNARRKGSNSSPYIAFGSPVRPLVKSEEPRNWSNIS